MPDLYAKPQFLSPLCLWVTEGETGAVMCFDCKTASCWGCPACWRKVNGRIEYWREPIHGYVEV